MIKKCLGLIVGLLLLTGCNQLAILSVAGSTASLVINNNALVKTYSGLDVVTFMTTEKDIKTHAYETAVSVGVVVENVKEVVNETFILEKPITFESEKRVLVALPIIEVKVSELLTVDDGFYIVKNFENYRSKEDIEWEIESEGWKKVYSKYYE